MHPRSFVIAFAFALCCGLPCQSSGEEAGWISLFNGKDLTGWEANVAPDSFFVRDGVLVAHDTSPDVRSHLFYVGTGIANAPATFKDFELEAVVKAEPNSNSGIFFHTDRSVRDAKMHLGKGYELQLNSSEKEKRKTGSLYAVVDLAKSPVDETGWFTVRLRVKGKRIEIFLNGQSVMDYTEPENAVEERPENRKGRVLDPNGGAVALQAHDPDSVFYFQSIRIRPL